MSKQSDENRINNTLKIYSGNNYKENKNLLMNSGALLSEKLRAIQITFDLCSPKLNEITDAICTSQSSIEIERLLIKARKHI